MTCDFLLILRQQVLFEILINFNVEMLKFYYKSGNLKWVGIKTRKRNGGIGDKTRNPGCRQLEYLSASFYTSRFSFRNQVSFNSSRIFSSLVHNLDKNI